MRTLARGNTKCAKIIHILVIHATHRYRQTHMGKTTLYGADHAVIEDGTIAL